MAKRSDNALTFDNLKGIGFNSSTGAVEPIVDVGTALGTAAAAASALRFSDVFAENLTLQSDTGIRGRFQVLEEEITLSTGGATTDSSANLFPAASVILALRAEVTTTITTATNWAVGDATTADRFVDATTDLTATTIKYGLNVLNPAKTAAYTAWQPAAAKLRITTTGSNPGAGKVLVTVFAFTLTDAG